jgi:N-acetylneuraminate lyase
MTRFEGLIAAAHSPMHLDGSLATESVPEQAKIHREQKNSAVFICGSTGEGNSLSRDERMELAESWGSETDLQFKLIVHVGCNALPDACALAEHADHVGAHAISCQSPCFEKPQSIEALVGFLAAVASRAPGLPFYWYDIPALTGVDFPSHEVLDAAHEAIPNLAGIKFTSADGVRQQACVELLGGRFEVLHGCDELLLDGLSRGCHAAVGSTYNYATPIYRRVIDLLEIGDERGARAAQEQAVALVDVIQEYGVLRAGKAIMGLLGVECGPPRLPCTPLEQAELDRLRSQLEGFDFLARPIR